MTFERQILGLQVLLLELKDVPATTGILWRIELHRRRGTPGLHGAEELRNQIRREAGTLQILFSSKADVAAVRYTLGVRALGPRDRCEIRAVLQLLVNAVDLDLRVRLSLSIVVLDAGLAVVRGIHRNHRQRYTAGVDELRFVRVVVILDFAITDTDLARIFILQRVDRQDFLPFFSLYSVGLSLIFDLPVNTFRRYLCTIIS